MQKVVNRRSFLKSSLAVATLPFIHSAQAAEFVIPPKNLLITPDSGNLPLEQRLLEQISPEERPVYERHGKNTEYSIVTDNDQLFALCTKEGQEFFKRKISQAVANTIKRLRQPSKYIAQNFLDIDYAWNSSPLSLKSLNDSLVSTHRHPQEVLVKAEQTLKQAGPNARSFLQAIDLLSKDPAKNDLVHAGIFYLANMQGHGYAFRSSEGIRHLPDTSTMTATAIYENVFYAHKAWKEFPWAKDVSKEDFLNILLPARSTQEPLQRWHRHAYEALAPETRKLRSVEEALRFINQLSFARVKYMPCEFEDMSHYLRDQACGGRCEDQTNDMVDLGKAIGLPVVSVNVPWWGNANDNHVWAGVQTPARILSVNAGDPAKEQGLDFNYDSSAPKVFITSPFTRKDVTSKFTSTTDLSIPASNFEGRAGLFVFNYGAPREVDSTTAQNGKLSFKDVGSKDILYIVGKANNGKLEQLTDPFLLTAKGPQTFYSTHPHQGKNHAFYAVGEEQVRQPLDTGRYIIAAWYDGNYIPMNPDNPLPAKEVNGKRVLEQVHLAPNIIYHLFKVEGKSTSPHGRPFTVENGKVAAH